MKNQRERNRKNKTPENRESDGENEGSESSFEDGPYKDEFEREIEDLRRVKDEDFIDFVDEEEYTKLCP